MNKDTEVRERFGRIWPAHVGSLTRFLIECRQHFDGDLDMMLVMAVIGDRTLSLRRVDPSMSYEEFMAPLDRDYSEDINARSIADFSGIPRETVRRKVAQLIEKGWIQRNENGFLNATSRAKQDLEPLTLTSIKYLASMMKVLEDNR